MKGNRAILAGLVLVLVALGVGYWVFVSERQRQIAIQEVAEDPLDVAREALEAGGSEEIQVQLFFCNPSRLPPGSEYWTEERTIYRTENAALLARQLVGELWKGTRDGWKIVPEQVRLRQLYLLSDGTAVVDLSREVADSLNGGALAELVILYSLTRTLRENIPAIQRVRFLVDGAPASTLAGHVSIQDPFM